MVSACVGGGAESRGRGPEPRPNPFLVASLLHGVGAQTQISFTLDTVVAVALVIFFTGFMLGVLGCGTTTKTARSCG